MCNLTANPEYIYAIVEASQGKGGFFRSTNRGASWEKRSSYTTSGNYLYNTLNSVNCDSTAILYLTILAASVFYSMIDPIWIALILLLLIGVVSVRLSLIRNSQPLAAIGLFGAFLGPPLLDGFSSHEDGLFIFQQESGPGG